MLLPFFAMGVTCGYAMFNKNAYQSYYGDTINDERIIDVSVDDFVQTKTYYIQVNNVSVENSLSNSTFYCSYIKNLSTNTVYDMTIYDRIRFFKNANTTQVYTQILRIDDGTSITLSVNNLFEFTYVSTSTNGAISDYLNFYEIEYIDESYLSEVFYYSVDRVKESPIFSWAYNSFLATPIVYITSLFSIPVNHLVVQLLSYWLAISVIWLVFDLIMYVPLLVHRWIDKGVLE